MHIIVILHIAPVALVDLSNEPRKLHLVQLLHPVDVEHLQNVDSHHRQCCLAPERLAELESVEVDLVGVGEMRLVLLDVIMNRVEACGAAPLRNFIA